MFRSVALQLSPSFGVPAVVPSALSFDSRYY